MVHQTIAFVPLRATFSLGADPARTVTVNEQVAFGVVPLVAVTETTFVPTANA